MQGVTRSTLFITGTDTGVGKTVLACLLIRRLRQESGNVAALKPVCSGGREDARQLRAASGYGLGLAEINPWHFRLPLSPMLAGRTEKSRLPKAQVLAHVR